MAIMIREIYDAFRKVGADEETAQRAAEAVAGYENRFNKLELELADMRGTLRLHAWILATNTAMLTAILFKVFS